MFQTTNQDGSVNPVEVLLCSVFQNAGDHRTEAFFELILRSPNPHISHFFLPQ